MVAVEVAGGADRWEARDGGDTVGVLRAFARPDRRTFLRFLDCRDDAYRPLLARAVGDLGLSQLYTGVDERDPAALQRLAGLGFVISRHEHRYRVPVATTRFRPDLAVPAGIVLISAAGADLDRLRLLDDELRNDTPGADGWRWSPEEFREETFSDGFDPATYLIAVEERTGQYVGLIRLWMRAGGPRFGFIGTVPRWRRTRVTYRLLSTVFREIHRRGCRAVEAEVDATNRASNAIAARASAVRVGGSYVLVRDNHVG